MSIAFVGCRTSSVTLRLNYVHMFWTRMPGDGDNRRLGVGLGDSELLTEGNRKGLLQCGMLRMLKRYAGLTLMNAIHNTFTCVYMFMGCEITRCKILIHLHVVAHRNLLCRMDSNLKHTIFYSCGGSKARQKSS